MKLSDIATLLNRVDAEQDGSYRVVASKAIENVLGGFRFYDTRPDDPNDIVPHEHRRELRGYGVFSAWLNHVDAKAINSMDALVREEGRSVVRHYLLDFGSTLGSASLTPREHWEGFEYMLEPQRTWREMLAFGFYIPEWRRIDFYEAPAIGRLPRDNTRFDPEQWKPRVPNPAFLRSRADDKFWAAQKLVAFTDPLLTAAVRAGQFGDARSEDFLVQALRERRDAIARTYLTAVNPVSDPAIDQGSLTFRNAAVDARVADPPREYRAAWFVFDNMSGESRALVGGGGSTGGAATGPRLSLPLPGNLPDSSGAFVRVDISATGGANASWERPVQAYFQRDAGSWRLVGFERLP
jgi:hypothetical protein